MIRELIDYAATQVVSPLWAPELKLLSYIDVREAFDALATLKTPWRGFIYHVPVPKDQSKVEYRDIKALDHSVYDYDTIVSHAVRQGRAILVNQRLYPFDSRIPMYERVRAMCAYVHSTAFNSPTVFLDGDAFVNVDLEPLFKTIRDVGVTYRSDPGLMPINEGVIFAQPTEGTRAFFRAYLSTYERLAKDQKIIEYYGDIKRWRGGQLTLNALTCPPGIPSEMDTREVFGCQVQYLPCFTWNYSPDGPHTKEDLDAKGILHLKGDRKKLIQQVIGYQEHHNANL